MPRRREVPKRVILDDPKFSSQEVSKFVNVIMSSGKKSVAERIIYGAFDQIKTKSGKDPLETFSLALARNRGEKSMGLRLAAEIMEASENKGAAMKKRDEVHRMAEANKAFSHFRF